MTCLNRRSTRTVAHRACRSYRPRDHAPRSLTSTHLAMTEVNPGPFVVSYPCAVCRGEGCAACRGTGVERFFHGTKAELSTGDLIEPGYGANYGRLDRTTTYVYLTGTLDLLHGQRSWRSAKSQEGSTSWGRSAR
jgi:Rifampin ADP-ribosyl transferase